MKLGSEVHERLKEIFKGREWATAACTTDKYKASQSGQSYMSLTAHSSAASGESRSYYVDLIPYERV